MMGAVFGLGFIHAKDRLWQMHFYKMLTQGRVSELLGSDGVSIDKYIRTIGIPRAAQHQWEVLDLESKTLLENYANGVNKVIENVVLYPIEFNLMWSTPETWQP